MNALTVRLMRAHPKSDDGLQSHACVSVEKLLRLLTYACQDLS